MRRCGLLNLTPVCHICGCDRPVMGFPSQFLEWNKDTTQLNTQSTGRYMQDNVHLCVFWEFCQFCYITSSHKSKTTEDCISWVHLLHHPVLHTGVLRSTWTTVYPGLTPQPQGGPSPFQGIVNVHLNPFIYYVLYLRFFSYDEVEKTELSFKSQFSEVSGEVSLWPEGCWFKSTDQQENWARKVKKVHWGLEQCP